MTATHPPSATPAMTTTPVAHTSTEADALLDRAKRIAPILREHAEPSERERRLARPVLDALANAGFQRLMAPKSLGGLEVDPMTCFRVVEELARADSAAAWSLQSGNAHYYWFSRFPEATVEEVYGSTAKAMIAAAFHPPQQATEVDGGYTVSGRAPLASIIHDCDWIILSAFIMENGQPRMTPFGPAVLAILLPTSEVKIIDTWHALGMRGTDSNDVAFTNVFVPERHTFPLMPEFAPGKHFQGPLYRYPAIPIIALFSAGVVLAAARGAIDELRDLAQKKVPMGSLKTLRDRGVVQAALAESEAMLRSARGFFLDTMSEAWERTTAGRPNTLEHKADLLLAGVHAAKTAAHVTDTMHRLAGTTGIYARSPLERHFRDAHTLRHHGFVSEGKLESVGQVYLGLPPDFPLIAF